MSLNVHALQRLKIIGKTFQSIKRVHGVSIKTITTSIDGGCFITVKIEASDPSIHNEFEFDATWCAQYKPEIGGYLVLYENDYVAYSPKEVFESGNIPVSEIDKNLLKNKGCIYEDHNGVVVLANMTKPENSNATEKEIPGHCYEIHSGKYNSVYLDFQNGPIKEVGLNGMTNECLLAILINRINHLDQTFPCEENKRAAINLNSALSILNERTNKRIAQNVEGLNIPHISV